MPPPYLPRSHPAATTKAVVSGTNKQEAVGQWASFSGVSSVPASSFAPSRPPVQQKIVHDAQNSKTPGHNPNSAHHSKLHVCSYNGCNRRFDKEKGLRIHKEAEHDYCKVCDEDYDDSEALHFHKMQSERHVVCNICGVEFQSEPGRDRHAKQMHAAQQNVECKGCHKVFAKGSGLLLHFEQNACIPIQSKNMADRQIRGREMLNAHRAMLAMQMEQIAEENAAKKAAYRSAMSAMGTDAASETDGGVRVQPSLLDDLPESEADFGTTGEYKGKANEFQNLIQSASMHTASIDRLQQLLVPASTHNQSSTTSVPSVSSTGTAKTWGANYPTLKPRNQAEELEMQAALENVSIKGSVKSSTSNAWGNAAQKLFPDARPTPVPNDVNIDNLKGINVGEDAADSAPGTVMTVDPITNKYKCLFPTCDKQTEDVYQMIEHMQTHPGLENRCHSCLRIFGSTSALVAHMESASTRCNIRNTKNFSNAIHIVSGGFLGAFGRLEDGTVAFQSQKKPESFW